RIANTPAFKWGVFTNDIQILARNLGEQLQPKLNDLLDVLLKLKPAIEDAGDKWGPVVGNMQIVIDKLSKGEFRDAAETFQAIITAAFPEAGKKIQDFRDLVSGLGDEWGPFLKKWGDEIKKGLDELIAANEPLLNQLKDDFSAALADNIPK